MKKRIFIILCLLFSKTLFATNITVQADFNPVLLSDSFHLTYEADGSVDDDPDFSPLEQDFEILSRSQSSNISIINGNYKRSKKWTLTVMAKQAGIFTLPAISFGSDASPQMQLTVKASSPNQSKSYGLNKKQMLELETSNKEVWVQGQVILTVRLLTSENISSYRFSDVKIDKMDVVIEQLGKEKQYKTYRGNTPYLVVERRYALFPQQTGTININPMVAEVDVPNNRRSNSFFDPFGRSTQTRRIRSAATKIHVKNIPDNFKAAHWLPAKEIQLMEEWPENVQFKVGEPVTRTLSILADGLTSAQLPELSPKNISGLKQYPDQANLHDTKNDDGIVGIREEKMALIPTHAGRFTLPAIEIPWWNTQTNKMEVARIAEKVIQVSAAATQAAQPSTVAPQLQTPAIVDNTETPPITNPPHPPVANNLWFYLSLILAALWLLTLFIWWLSTRKKNSRKATTPPAQHTVSVKEALKKLQQACRNNDAQACKKALIIWGQVSLQQAHLASLGELAKQVDEPLKSKINALNQHLYAAQETPWQADNLADDCQKQTPKKTTKNNHSNELEPLYKA